MIMEGIEWKNNLGIASANLGDYHLLVQMINGDCCWDVIHKGKSLTNKLNYARKMDVAKAFCEGFYLCHHSSAL